MDRFELTYFYGPEDDYIVKDETVEAIARAGFTLAPLDSPDPQVNKRALRLFQKHGLRAMVRDRRLSHLICTDDPEVDRLLGDIIDDYREFDNIAGWMLQDEPAAHHFPRLAQLTDAIRRLDPGREAYVNLFPNYCSAQGLECRDYEEYLDRFIAEVKPPYLSYDHYHFVGRFSGESMMDMPADADEREREIILAAKRTEDRPSFFANLEIVREKGLAHGLPLMVIILLTEHGEYRNLCEAEIRWELYSCLAYGAKRLSYFTYWTPEWEEVWRFTNAMANRDGTLTQHYQDVCAINPGLLRLGRELYGKTSEAVYHLRDNGEAVRRFVPHGDLKAVRGEGDAVVGFFDDGSFLVVNKDYKQAAAWELEAPALEFFSEEDGGWHPAGAAPVLTADSMLTLPAGDGLLLRRAR